MDEPVWVPTVFTKNRDRLLTQEIARSFFRRVVERAQAFMSDEHFTVDGTLIEAWASQKSFQRKDGPADGDGRNFHGQARKNDTHASTTDPDAKLYRKSTNAEARLAYLGHLLIENRHGLIVDAMATAGRWARRTRCRPADAPRSREGRALETAHDWRGQELRYGGLRDDQSRAEGDAARQPESEARRRAAPSTPGRRATRATHKAKPVGRASNGPSAG